MTSVRNIAEAHRRQAERLGPQGAVRYKRGESWQDLTWSTYRADALACAAATRRRATDPAGLRAHGKRAGALAQPHRPIQAGHRWEGAARRRDQDCAGRGGAD